MSIPKVLIITPTYEGKDYCFDRFIETAKAINYPNKKHIIIDNGGNKKYYRELKKRVGKHMRDNIYHVDRGNNSREALARAQEFARRYALDNGYDYMLSLESDLFPPADIIQRLLLHCTPVVSALYHIGDKNKGQRVPCISVMKDSELGGTLKGTRLLTMDEWPEYHNKGLKQVHHAGIGCTLISRRVLEKVGFFYDFRYKGHSDIWFANDLHRYKIPVFVDTDIIIEHDNVPWSGVKDR